MKNIFLIKTTEKSRLHDYSFGNIGLSKEPLSWREARHLYITSHEEIKENINQWYLDRFLGNKPYQSGCAKYNSKENVVILTTDPKLIADGIKAIDEEFLQWFVKNPTCEYVEVQKWFDGVDFLEYKIIIPQQKQLYKKIYISGAITGTENAENLFKEAELQLIYKGYDVINPFSLPHNHNKTWNDYMREDLKALLDCDEIYMLKNWETSRGAKIEHAIARELDLKVNYQK